MLLFTPLRCWVILTVTISLSGQWWSVLVKTCSRGCLLQIRTTPLTGWLVTMRTMRANRSLTVPDSTARRRLLHPPVPLHTWARLTAAAVETARWRKPTDTLARSGRPLAGDLPRAAQRPGTETAPLDCIKHNKEKTQKTLSEHWRDTTAPQRRSSRNGSSFQTCQRKTDFSAARWASLWLMPVSYSNGGGRVLEVSKSRACHFTYIWYYRVPHAWHFQ